MGVTAQFLTSGDGWRVCDVVCDSGPYDLPFEEQHSGMCIAAVTQGTFQYRTAQGSAVLAPGAVLLGNDRDAFECAHDHSTGDRCLSFHLTPDFLEKVTSELRGAPEPKFSLPRLPPVDGLTPLLAAAEVARDEGDALHLEELAVRIAGAVALTLQGVTDRARAPTAYDVRRVSEVLHWIEGHLSDPLTLSSLSHKAAMSPYHFLRTFREVVGVTPHQYVLRTRLRRACVELRRSDEPVSTIAFNSGFSDLSTFNRQFRRMVKAAPSVYRRHG